MEGKGGGVLERMYSVPGIVQLTWGARSKILDLRYLV